MTKVGHKTTSCGQKVENWRKFFFSWATPPSQSVPKACRGARSVLRVEPVLDSEDGHVGVGQQGLERSEQRRDPVEHHRSPALSFSFRYS